MPQVIESPSGKILHGSLAGHGSKVPGGPPVFAPALPPAPPAPPLERPPVPPPAVTTGAEPPLPPRLGAPPLDDPPTPIGALPPPDPPAAGPEPPLATGPVPPLGVTTGAEPPLLCIPPLATGPVPPEPLVLSELEQPRTSASALTAQALPKALIGIAERFMGFRGSEV